MRIEWLSVPVCQRKVLAANSRFPTNQASLKQKIYEEPFRSRDLRVSNKSGFIKTEDIMKNPTPTHPSITNMDLRIFTKSGH